MLLGITYFLIGLYVAGRLNATTTDKDEEVGAFLFGFFFWPLVIVYYVGDKIFMLGHRHQKSQEKLQHNPKKILKD